MPSTVTIITIAHLNYCTRLSTGSTIFPIPRHLIYCQHKIQSNLLQSKLDHVTSVFKTFWWLYFTQRKCQSPCCFLHNLPILPISSPTCLASSSLTLALTHFAAATLVSLLYFKHCGHTSTWNAVSNACNIGFSQMLLSQWGIPWLLINYTRYPTPPIPALLRYTLLHHIVAIWQTVHFNYLNHPTKM